ncbi:3-hydroxybutyryl-CoA dehydrogenase [Acinetobacter gyllenbergii]|uniref:L-gulonate 3-dehydrogenase n=1 Tax=Acinetobacter gyllenbergii CIP 110306 = MTCC 11365 TaxID=1217657 RepID=A0A829HB89_9GAMM|nr:3-hydroxybutyryl-CoA dehydrogenase [Acinetobacter gyllenbergii]EPF69440.1 3-hydroxybutyryl-CoA dehydrogenase [Acinetobacter gyllenbergii CIP 110306 = MTCC 11365]EPH32975.1 3-hydroxybutyryl-CoA dehydrogenase [Acinetobacter gyllenbergii CIP 110306 = MTCC 11365]GMA11483.1 3-hydroxybutyryl-CoA dehydrogenase [Acinetobacter gyllenbergii]
MSTIKQVAVLGAGRMGKAIALAFAYAGLKVDLIDARERSEVEFGQYQNQIQADLQQELGLLEQIQFIQPEQQLFILDQITILSRAGSLQRLAGCELVMEAVPEVKPVKQEIFAWLDQYISPHCIVASTTSTFLVTDIAEMISHPERVLNAHWLNPAYLIPLVELSRSEQTSERVVAQLKSFLQLIGKVPVVCHAKAGYIVPRIQALAMNEAARMVEEGVASAEDIDIAIRTGFGLRFSVLGLLEFIDWGGGDILYYASQYLQKELGDRYRTPEIIAENMRQQRNGLREQQGFYDYQQVDIPAYKQQVLHTFSDRIAANQLKPPFNILNQ